ncbi:MAG: ABC transporter permease, partial [Gammaproteobacteria bacterium]|nr:ABC transporter permease [Gammaproteobacteria bacterium]
GDESFIKHNDQPFRVVGVLAATGTPVDRSVHVSLAGFDHMHEAWQQGGDEHGHDPLTALTKGADQGTEEVHDEHEEHAEHGDEHSISAFMLGLESRAATIGLQRRINQFEVEPLSAILPGVALLELWEIVGLVEKTLLAISVFVVIVGLFSMLIILTTSINERRREMAILRAMGARPGHVFSLILGEAIFITLTGIGLGIMLVFSMIVFGQGWIASEFGLYIGLKLFSLNQVYVILLVALFGCLIGLIPGIRMYRYSLIDGMTIRV